MTSTRSFGRRCRSEEAPPCLAEVEPYLSGCTWVTMEQVKGVPSS